MGMRNAVYGESSSALPCHDAKPARFALNQGSRKFAVEGGGVTCPGLIRCAGLEHSHQKSTRSLNVNHSNFGDGANF